MVRAFPNRVVSIDQNGAALNSSSPVGIDFLKPSVPWGHEIDWLLNFSTTQGQPSPVSTDDTFTVVINTGHWKPERSVAFPAYVTSISEWQDTSTGNWFYKIIGKPVNFADGCDASKPWPWPCPYKATSDDIRFGGEIHTLNAANYSSDQDGFDVGTNVQYNGIFMETDSGGNQYLETEEVAPHVHTDNSTLVTGSMYFHLPDAYLRGDFNIPDPSTMVAGSMVGTINGNPASFTIVRNMTRGGIDVTVSGFTFTRKIIRLKVGNIRPTRPRITSTARLASTRASLRHTMSTPRGARVTGYVAVCTARNSTIRGTGAASSPRVIVTKLRPGTAYSCKVAANSKAGRGPWSATATVRR